MRYQPYAIAIRCVTLLLVLTTLAGLESDALAARLTTQTDVPWPLYNQHYDGQRFSPLTEITPANVTRLKVACSLRLGDDGPFQSGPLVVDGLLYVTTAHTTVALDPTSCAVRWRHVYQPTAKEVWIVNRGAGYADGRLFRGTPDGHLLALDAKSGAVLWITQAGDPAHGEYVSAAPIAWQGRVYVGLAGSDFGIRGRIMAFDTLTGKESWHFNTIPMGSEVGANSWRNPASALHGGGGTWSSYALDEQSGELFLSVGNPGPDYLPDRRPGNNLFTNSMVVLDAKTGTLKWWYQVTPNDSHDWDLAAAPMLFRDSTGRSRVALGAKNGHLYVIDRHSHQLVFKTALIRQQNISSLPTPEGVRVCPGGQSGVHWNGPAFDPIDQRLIVGAVDGCGVFKSLPDTLHEEGAPYGGGYFVPDQEPPFGWISAVDDRSGRLAWRYRSDAPIVAGMTVTAGGVVFTGDLAGHFLALDRRQGKRLFSLDTDGAVAGGVITYSIAGRQYVATTSGNVSRTSFKTTGTPTLMILALDATPLGTVSVMTTANPDAAVTRTLGFIDINWGMLQYEKFCASCHGPRGEGISGPTLKDLTTRRTIESTIDSIQHPKAPMPALYPSTLNEQDVADLASYIRRF